MSGKYGNRVEKVWERAKKCNCGQNDCHPNNHRLCGICGCTILYGSHESVESQRNSQFLWNIDHIKPISIGRDNSINNMRAVHVSCNRRKSNRYWFYIKQI